MNKDEWLKKVDKEIQKIEAQLEKDILDRLKMVTKPTPETKRIKL